MKKLKKKLDALLPVLMLGSGAGLIVAGAAMISPSAGCITAGVFGILYGVLSMIGGARGGGGHDET